MRIRIPLSANVPARQNFQAQSIVLASLGAASSVRLMVLGSDQQDAEDYGQCERLFGIYDPARVFTGVELTATVDCTVELIVSRSRVEVMDGATVLATIDAAQLPLPVETTRGDAPGNPYYVSGVTYTDTPASASANAAPVAMGAAVAQIIAAGATRLRIIFTNTGAVPVAIGAAGLTWANRCLVLNPGDTWVEDKGAALAWHGITEAAAGSVTTQVLTA